MASTTLRFSVGKKYVVLNLHDAEADDNCGNKIVEENMRKIFANEDLPCYLEVPLLSALHSLNKEEINSCPSTYVEALFDEASSRQHAEDWAESFKSKCLSWRVNCPTQVEITIPFINPRICRKQQSQPTRRSSKSRFIPVPPPK